MVGQEVRKSWGKTAVHDGLTFRVEPGITALLGANGSGKTTLLGMILGLHKPDSGSLRVFGLDPSTAGHEIRGAVGYSPEHHTLPPDVRAHDLVRHIAELHGLPNRDATNRASDALWAVGLGEERFRPIGTMSTGQRQRVKLAQAIAHDPALVLLDEPTDGLDPVQRDQMLDLIRRCGTEFGINILLSSHLLEEVERVCDAVVILGGGQVVANGTIEELRGGGQGVVVEVDDHGADVAALLRARRIELHLDGNRITISSTDEAVLDLVRDAVAQVGTGLRRLHPRRLTLEEVFLGVALTDSLSSSASSAHGAAEEVVRARHG
ncbi:MAG: ATP-binding cassette domain-containing protein [Actinobacteria bacterium]|nr:ATP-binding cassette domain-containing protein [Actinomycetota bacterium]MSY72050.1 ATP-binding cassette domain-containing protein [Actinomycetota bacterium]